MPVEISDDRRGEDVLARVIAELRATRVSIGVHQQDAERKDDGPSNVLIASVHEFGAPDHRPPIPARPFLRTGVAKAKAKIIATSGEGIAAAVVGDLTAKQVAARVGEVALQSVLQTINAGIAPPLAPATVAARYAKTKSKSGPLTPLVDTGQLRASLTYQVETTEAA